MTVVKVRRNWSNVSVGRLLVLFKYFNHILYFVLFIIYYLLFSIRLIKKKYNILYLNKKKSLYLKNIVPGTENISILA